MTQGDVVVIAELPGIGRVATRALAEREITTLDQVPALTEAELLAVHGVGPKAVRILREALDARGMRLRE
jgi:predicted flap endonuclease-1-like 5' DNA nuclease